MKGKDINMAKKAVKFLVFAVMSIIVGLGINYYVTSELIMICFMGSERLYPIVVIFALIIQIKTFNCLLYSIYGCSIIWKTGSRSFIQY